MARPKKAQTAEKKREEKALGPFKKLSPLNMFIKENYHKTGSLAKTSQEWTQLAEGEKEAYAQKAEKYNAENLKLYIPKPTHPTPAYAKFTKTSGRTMVILEPPPRLLPKSGTN